MFTRPWKMSMLLYRRKEPNVRLLEYEPGFLMEEEQRAGAGKKRKSRHWSHPSH